MIAKEQLNRPIVSVDFDGTMKAAPKAFDPIPTGPPLPGVARALSLLSHEHEIHIYTARDVIPVWEWLSLHGLADFITSVTNKKPKGHVALFDDSAVPVQRNTPNALLTAVKNWLEHQPIEPLIPKPGAT